MQSPTDRDNPGGLLMPVPEVLGATAKPFQLNNHTATVSFDLHSPSGPASHATNIRYTLLVENYTASTVVPSYKIYLNLPSGSMTEPPRDHFVNLLPIFGLVEASLPNGTHGGQGLTSVTDITALVARLALKGDWDGKHVNVTFVPYDSESPFQVNVSRVSLAAQ